MSSETLPVGIEPTAYSLEGCHSIQLSYGSKQKEFITNTRLVKSLCIRFAWYQEGYYPLAHGKTDTKAERCGEDFVHPSRAVQRDQGLGQSWPDTRHTENPESRRWRASERHTAFPLPRQPLPCGYVYEQAGKTCLRTLSTRNQKLQTGVPNPPW